MKVMFFVLMFGLNAHANVSDVKVCGTHTITARTHYIEVSTGDLEAGKYELFAANPFSASLLGSLENQKQYCIVGGFNTSRPDEGINLISVQGLNPDGVGL